jgi:hypothetical protein
MGESGGYVISLSFLLLKKEAGQSVVKQDSGTYYNGILSNCMQSLVTESDSCSGANLNIWAYSKDYSCGSSKPTHQVAISNFC